MNGRTPTVENIEAARNYNWKQDVLQFQKYFGVFLWHLGSKQPSESGYYFLCQSTEFLAICQRFGINDKYSFDRIFSELESNYVSFFNQKTQRQYDEQRRATERAKRARR